MAVPAGSFSLSTVFRMLGLRDPRVLPKIAPDGELVGVVNFGNLDALVSELIEARTIVNIRMSTLAAGHWTGVAMQIGRAHV